METLLGQTPKIITVEDNKEQPGFCFKCGTVLHKIVFLPIIKIYMDANHHIGVVFTCLGCMNTIMGKDVSISDPEPKEEKKDGIPPSIKVTPKE